MNLYQAVKENNSHLTAEADLFRYRDAGGGTPLGWIGFSQNSVLCYSVIIADLRRNCHGHCSGAISFPLRVQLETSH
jgi:hypothetical protein